jgi:hypothetical protein
MRPVNLEIDHLVICVADLDEAASRYGAALDLDVLPGGRHTGHGTANRIIPLGGAYIELLGVVDVDEARDSPLGSWAQSRSGADGIHALCLRTDDIDVIAAGMGMSPSEMSRALPDGPVLRWRIAGLERALVAGSPFFIAWDVPEEAHPGFRRDGRSLLGPVELSGDESLAEALPVEVAGLSVTVGPPALKAEVNGIDI